MKQMLHAATEYIRQQYPEKPDIAVVLGSGLGDWADTLTDSVTIAYTTVPGMPVSDVAGHGNCFIFGKKCGKTVMVMKGRVHLYEGKTVQDVVFPIRLMYGLDIPTLVLTNAAGAVNTDYRPGDLMLLTDHINLSGHNCLIGTDALDFGVRFPSMCDTYDSALRKLVTECAERLGVLLRRGVYYYCTGPSYETPAEICAIRSLGGDAVGMSTVHEATAAVQQGMKVLGISCITNMAAGILAQPLSHEEVMQTGKKVKEKFARLLDQILSSI